ncbi:MAG: non-lysosomal glucosylceramidase, partial [Kribbellaceae bacterium]|nr:non-lysosomal glucosylceramidase [Kribbellaceae bacterium]
CCSPAQPDSDLSRRRFLFVGAAGVGAAMIPAEAVAAGVRPENVVMVPANKGLTAEVVQALADRGTPTEYTGAALARIGMPVGGACCGQVYLAGDGRLWAWDILNPGSYPLGGADGGGPHYASPLSATAPFKQGFVLRTEAGGTVKTRALDSTGFSNVRFVGRYPIGTVTYQAPDSPVEVTLDAFSPFIPLATDDSTLPVIVMSYTLRNTSTGSVQASLAGFTENPVCSLSATQQPTRLLSATFSGKGVEFSAADPLVGRPDVPYEDWERDTYAPWTTTGTAFGAGPVVASTVPELMKRFDGPAQHLLNCSGTRLVTSYNYRGGVVDPDTSTGTLTSPEFTISRRYVAVALGGGNHSGGCCVNVLVDGLVVATATGADDERVMVRLLDVGAYEGRIARIQLVDNQTGAWGHVNCDGITFTDRDDVIFEDWEKDDFAGWTVTGNAFGAGPVRPQDAPADVRRFGDLNISGTRYVTSYNWRAGGNFDSYTGRLTSAPFRITRRYVSVPIGGGDHAGTTCVNVVVDGVVVATATSRNSEPLIAQALDVGGWEGRTAQIEIVDNDTGPWGHLSCDAISFTDAPDIVFEEWDRTSFAPWTGTGTAFGTGPVTPADLPTFFKRPFGEITDLNVSGARFVTSYNWRVGDSDTATGTLTSPEFTISRKYVTAWVGGGNHPGQTCFNVLVDGQVVASRTGQDIEPMQGISMDVSRYAGRKARVQLVDQRSDGWGHLNCDRIIFSNRPVRNLPLSGLTDNGTFALAALDPGAVVRPSIADWSTPAAVLDSAAGPAEVNGLQPMAGAVTVSATLAPGETRTVRFALAWYFPRPAASVTNGLQGGANLRHHYATRFAAARDVVSHLSTNLDRLEGGTRSWVQTFYGDSTLPYWFCERTLANASTLATNTCYRFDNGRFYGFEGIYCCVGTCQHVWNYAQSVARLFPDLERDTRERVDLGLAFRASGEMQNRGEGESSFADGHCGTILRIYREHQMAPDSAFLTRVWPKVRTSVNYLIGVRDVDSDGIFEGSQWNTLDTEWFGEVPWISGLYVAALRAAGAMAAELGDTTSADKYQLLADRGSAYLANSLWNASYGYFEQKVDPAHAAKMNSNRGCYIDQMYGQAYAAQLGLPRVFPADKSKVALGNIFRNNFLPDSSSYSRISGIPGGRVYSVAGEAGTVMCSWKFGGANQVGTDWAVFYFNEVWSGQEYQLAAQLFSEGLTTEGLAVTKAVHDRYSATKRNPYNEVECSDHYARAMMSHGVYLAACGYEHHGPKGHLGFAPRLSPEDFRAAFTAAEGWGSYRQTRAAGKQTATVELRHGQLTLRTFSQQITGTPTTVTVAVAGTNRPATLAVTGDRAVVTLTSPVVVTTGQTMEVTIG